MRAWWNTFEVLWERTFSVASKLAGGRRGLPWAPQQDNEDPPALSWSFLASHFLYDSVQMLSLSQGDPNQTWLQPEIRVTSAFSVAIFLALEVSDAWLHHRMSMHLRVVYFSVQIKKYIYICICIFSKFIIGPLSLISSFVIQNNILESLLLVIIVADIFWSFSFTPIVPWAAFSFLPLDSDFLGLEEDFKVWLPATGISWHETSSLLILLLSSFCLCLSYSLFLRIQGMDAGLRAGDTGLWMTLKIRMECGLVRLIPHMPLGIWGNGVFSSPKISEPKISCKQTSREHFWDPEHTQAPVGWPIAIALLPITSIGSTGQAFSGSCKRQRTC